MTNDNELDRWLRENTGSSQEPPAPDGWDTPSEQVWKGLRAGLDQRRKRRRGFLWIGALLLAITAGIAGWLSPKPFNPSVNIPATPSTNPGGVPPITISLMPPSYRPRPDRSGDRPLRGPSVGILVGSTTNVWPLRGLKMMAMGTTPKTTARLTFSPENTPGRGSEGSQPILDSTLLAEPPNPLAPAKNAEMAGILLQTENLAGSSSPTGSTALTPGDAVVQVEAPGIERPALPESTRTVPDRLDFLPPAQPAPLENRIRPLQEMKPAPVSIPEIRPQRRITGAYVAVTGGALYTSRLLRTPTGTVSVGRESGAWTTQAGALAGWPLNRRWALEAGIQWTAIHLQAERTIAFPYRQNAEQFDAQRFLYRNSAQETIETSFGAVEMRMDFGREPNRPIGDQALLRLTLQTDEQVRYVRIPLMLRWTAGAAGPWQWSLAGGIGLDIEAGYQLQMTAARADRPGVRAIRAGIQGRARGLSPLMADLQLGAGFDWNFAPHWSLRLAPEFRYGLSAMYRRGALRSKAVSGGVQLGVVYEGL